MNILHVLSTPNWSGTANYCLTLCLQEIKHGHRILLLTEPGKPFNRALKYGIPADPTLLMHHRNPALYVHSMKRYRHVFKTFKPDIISCHSNEGSWMAGFMARRFLPGAAVIRTRSDIEPPKGHYPNRLMYKNCVDHIIVGSLSHKHSSGKNLDYPEESIDVVYGSVDTQDFRPDRDPERRFRSEISVDDSTLLIGLLARLDPVKGHEYALKAFQLISKLPVKTRLVALGYEGNRSFSWLRKLAGELGVNDELLTFDYRNDIPAVLSSLDIGLITSIGSEANSRATLEFMSSGKPIVSTAVGVIPEIIEDGEHGFLVPAKNPEASAAALSRLIMNPPLRNAMGQSARERVERNFDLELFYRNTLRVYEKAARKRTGCQPEAGQ